MASKMLCLLIGSQVGITTAIVRSAMTVEYDGSAHPYVESKITDNSRIAMAVDPAGALELTAKTNAKSLLTEVEEMVKAGSTPDNRTIRTIKEIVEDVLLPGLDKDVSEAQRAINQALAAIGKCNTTAEGKIFGVLKDSETDVEQKGKEHHDCRDLEHQTLENVTSQCGALKEKVDRIAQHQSMTSQQPPEQNWEKMSWSEYKGRVESKWVPYIESQTHFWCDGGENDKIGDGVKDKVHNCQPTDGEHIENHNYCDKKQIAFEGDFCTWVAQLTDTCETLDSCYDDAKLLYDNKVVEVQEQLATYQAQYEALHKILCYVDGWTRDNNHKTFQQRNIDECLNDRDWEDQHAAHIIYGTAPGKSVCPPASEKALYESYPGTDAFEAQWYRGKAWQPRVKPVQSCLVAVMHPAETPTGGNYLEESSILSMGELHSKKTSALRKIAVENGASPAELEVGDDADDSKKAFIALIHRLESRKALIKSARRSDLYSMKASALRKIAIGLGAHGADLEEGDDADDSKRAFIGLIHRLEGTTEEDDL